MEMATKQQDTVEEGGKRSKSVLSETKMMEEEKEGGKTDKNSFKKSAIAVTPSNKHIDASPQLGDPLKLDYKPVWIHIMEPDTWTLSKLRHVCLVQREEAETSNPFTVEYGNEIFRAWDQDVDAEAWPICRSTEAPFLEVKGARSWSITIDQLLKSHHGEWINVECAMRMAMDRHDLRRAPKWNKIRKLIMAVGRCDPVHLFRLSEDEDGSTFCNEFWDKCAGRNPRLLVDQKSFPKFWLLCSYLLGWPWVDPDITDLPAEFEALQKTIVERKQAETDKATTGRVAKNFQDVGIDAEMKSPARGTSDNGLTNKTHIGADIASPPKFQRGESNDAFLGLSSATGVDGRVTDHVTKEVDSNKKLSARKTLFKVPVGTIQFEQLPIRRAQGAAFQAISDAADKRNVKLTNREKFQSEADQARVLTQMRMDNLTRKHAKFFALAASTYYAGEDEEDLTVQDKVAQTIVAGFVQALECAPEDVMFLPVGDYQYTKKENWITTVEQAQALNSWSKLRQYLDLQWNNGINIARSKTEGDKTLRTRIRVAFNSDETYIESLLHDCWSHTGPYMGIYRSPLQVGNSVKIGWLWQYPVGVSIPLLERELMRYFGFKVPIALDLAFPASPGSNGDKKWVPGLHKQAWHVFVPAQYADMVSQELSNWLTKYTARCDMPYASATQFVPDWSRVRSKKQDVVGMSEMITELIGTHDNSVHMSCVIKPAFPIKLLVKTEVPLFGKSVSLLRVLFAIQCNPFVPAEKKLQATQVESQSDDKVTPAPESAPAAEKRSREAGSTDLEPSQPAAKSPEKKKRKDDSASSAPPQQEPAVDASKPASPAKKQRSKRKRNQKVKTPNRPSVQTKVSTEPPPASGSPAPQDPLTAMDFGVVTASADATPVSAEKLETVDELQARLLEIDMANFQPSPLFSLILPGEVDGLVLFVVRRKWKKLAENILNNLAAFLIFYLDLAREPIDVQQTILKAWVCKQHIASTQRYGMVWDDSLLTAVSEHDRNTEDLDVDENFEWLTSIRSPEGDAVFKGTLSMNLKLASARAIDDGATVVSRLNELRRLHKAASEHAEMVQELEAKTAEVQAHLHTLAEKDKQIQALQEQLAQQKLAEAESAGADRGSDDDSMQQEEGEDDEPAIAGEVEAADMDEDDDEADEEQQQGDEDDSFSTVQASVTAEDAMAENNEQHNDETAQADAGGGSSGSGS